jgi:transcriptional regulator with XRE-family HTH domain
MTPQDLITFRTREGWSRAELGRRLDVSASRIHDYELGTTRGAQPRPAPIPKVVELACHYLALTEAAPQAGAVAPELALAGQPPTPPR